MFEELSLKLETALKKIKGQGKLTEKNISDSLREIRRVLLDADVNYKVAKQFIENVSAKDGLRNTNYIYEPDQMHIFEYLIPKHLKAQVWRALLESNAAELSARMTAMDNATTNAQEMIRNLNLTYNKERQAAITKEILEIVSGANALKAS